MTLAETSHSSTSTQRLQRWRSVFRVLRFEEVIILGLLLLFFITLMFVDDAPSSSALWTGFAYHFHGNGTFWLFMQWCALGTLFLLMVAAVPLARTGVANQVMRGVWGEAATTGSRARNTLLWGLGGLRAYVPFLACMGVYELNKRLIPAVRGEFTYDIPLARLEVWALGDLASALVYKFMHQDWITQLITWLGTSQDQIHEAAYISYVYAAPALAIALWFLGRRTHFNRFMGALVICSAIAYVGYVLVPVVGPKWVFSDRWLQATTDGIAFMDALKGRNRDCFPSLHTAWTTLFLIASWRGVRPLFWVYLPVGIGVYISTLYGGEHYVLDLLAGHALAIFAWWVARPIRLWWDRLAGATSEKLVTA